MTNDIRVYLQELPMSVKGFTVLKDGFFTIVINSNLSELARIRTYKHELQHIYNDDFGKEDADSIEKDSHGNSLQDK